MSVPLFGANSAGLQQWIINLGISNSGSKFVAPKLKLNSETISVFLSSFVETINEKIKNNEKNKDV
jgi:hypothetical protein